MDFLKEIFNEFISLGRGGMYLILFISVGVSFGVTELLAKVTGIEWLVNYKRLVAVICAVSLIGLIVIIKSAYDL